MGCVLMLMGFGILYLMISPDTVIEWVKTILIFFVVNVVFYMLYKDRS